MYIFRDTKNSDSPIDFNIFSFKKELEIHPESIAYIKDKTASFSLKENEKFIQHQNDIINEIKEEVSKGKGGDQIFNTFANKTEMISLDFIKKLAKEAPNIYNIKSVGQRTIFHFALMYLEPSPGTSEIITYLMIQTIKNSKNDISGKAMINSIKFLCTRKKYDNVLLFFKNLFLEDQNIAFDLIKSTADFNNSSFNIDDIKDKKNNGILEIVNILEKENKVKVKDEIKQYLSSVRHRGRA